LQTQERNAGEQVPEMNGGSAGTEGPGPDKPDGSENKTTEKVWTSANIVTLIRILFIPVFVVVMLSPWPEWMPYPDFWAFWQPWIAAGVFAAISLTDAIDGHLARSRGEVTDLGKFMDPLADKILVCAALLALVELQAFPSWVALIIIARDFIVSGLRMVAASQGKVIAASYYGKVKTVLQMAAIILFIIKDSLQIKLLGGGFDTGFTVFSWIVLVAAVVMTLVSLVDYFAKSKELLGFK
jgi:nicotinamide-nucleotide amidase